MTMRAAAVSNDSVADEAAQEYLVTGGSAVGAVVAGYFASAGAFSGVLLGPVAILTAGIGVGARAFDGRLRQPGLGTKRPRGFKSGEAIPDAARVAIPTGVDAVLVSLAYDGNQSLGAVMKGGISRAQRSGADARAELLRRIRSAGASAMVEPTFVRSMLHVAGASEGGLVTPSDFKPAQDLDQTAVERAVADGKLLEVPWAESGAEAPGVEELGIGCAIIAVDVRGVFAALSFRRTSDGIPVDELDLEAPPIAIPVERNVARVPPGTRLPCPAPIAVRLDAAGTAVEVVAAPAARRLDDAARAPFRLSRDPSTQAVRVTRP